MNYLETKKWEHALACKNSACRVKGCNRSKKLLNHSRQCSLPRAVWRQKCGQCCKVISAARLHALHCRELLGCKEFPFCRRIKQNLNQCDGEFQDRDTLLTHITDKHKPVEKDLHKSKLNKKEDMKTECKLEDLCHDPCDHPDMDCIKKELKTEIKTEPIEEHE